MRTLSLSFTFLLFSIMASAQSPWLFTGKYPETKTVDHVDTYFVHKVADPYRWLENDRAEDTKRWVDSENKVTKQYLDSITYRDAIKKRLTNLWNFEKYGSAFKEGKYTYYYKNNGLQNQYVLYRQELGGLAEIFLDPNKFSTDGTSSLGGIDFCNDGSMAAFQVSEGGSDWRKVVVIATDTKKGIGDTLYNVKFSSISWYKKEGFYYSSYDKPKEGSELSGITQFHKLYYHKLGNAQKDDKLVFGGEQIQRRYISGSVTEDQRYLIISASNTTSGNELYIQDLNEKKGQIKPIVTGFEHEHEVVYEDYGQLFIVTSLNAPNRKLVTVSAANPAPSNWQEKIKESKLPLSVSSCSGKLFIKYFAGGNSMVSIYNTDGTMAGMVDGPGVGLMSGFSGKKTDDAAYFTFSSYLDPPSIYSYNFAENAVQPYKRSNLTVDYSQYYTTITSCLAKDGTEVQFTIVRRRDMVQDGNNPLLLYGYGGFNVTLTPSFSVSNLVLLENGGIFVAANIRGGGEFGEKWHKAGTKMNKQNVFDDFISVAEYLIKEKYTSSNYLAIAGGSNGGLLVGACMTQRPELFRVALPSVGVLDMLRYNRFTAGAGWASDYGTAQDSREMFEYLYNYSPLHNIRNTGRCFPSTLITTGDHDDRVVPAHSFKFAATLQAYQGCQNPVLINIEKKAGHGAGKSTAQQIQEQADKLSFMFWNMGLIHMIPKS